MCPELAAPSGREQRLLEETGATTSFTVHSADAGREAGIVDSEPLISASLEGPQITC